MPCAGPLISTLISIKIIIKNRKVKIRVNTINKGMPVLSTRYNLNKIALD